MNRWGKKQTAFTLVELLIVIVAIAILAAISIVAYNGIQERAKFSQLKGDLSSLNKAVLMYYADNGSYPLSSSWRGDGQVVNDAFIPGLVPKYINRTPQVEPHSETRPAFIYTSDGTDYKLIYIADGMESGSPGLPELHRQNNPLLDPARSTRAWGYWTEGFRTR